jgi:hypothetical protein
MNPTSKETVTGVALLELQGLNISVLGGQTTPTKHDLAAIRPEDTIVGALNNNAGTITDIKANLTIVDCKASGTLTATSIIATDAVEVNGMTYIFQSAAATKHGEVAKGANDTAAIANLAAAINAYENRYENGLNKPKVVATAATNVCTIKAIEEGTGGNAITLSSADSTIVASGATLSGGTATGGITSSSTTNQVILYWFNKK